MNKSETEKKIESGKQLINIHTDNVETRQTRIKRTKENLKSVTAWLTEYAEKLNKLEREYESANSTFLHAQKTFSDAKQKKESLEREVEERKRNQLLRNNTREKEEEERTLAQLERELVSETAKLKAVQNNQRVLEGIQEREAQYAKKQSER
jgi:alkanesulfonate monooxygenase SsuD/methylene tetrahydromethanopterin reductase-like flavin-dependent oxidoreductase (luciferase family)